MIKRYVRRITKKITNISAYGVFKILFWIAVVLLIITCFLISVNQLFYPISYLSFFLRVPDSDFFGSILNIILSVVSVVLVIVIFLVEHTSQRYSPRLPNKVLRNWYFIATLVIIFIGLLYGISGSFFEPGAPFVLFSYSFSIAIIALLLGLIAFAGYFINIANIVEYVSKKIKSKITSKKIYKPTIYGLPLHDEEFVDWLTNHTKLIVDTSVKSIEDNRHAVVDSSLRNLVEITKKFLNETSNVDVNEKFLNELNDQFEFINNTALESYSRQKYLEKIGRSMGDIGIEITKSRSIGYQGSRWAESLSRLFQKSLKYDRTSAPGISIEKLGEMTITAIEEENFQSARAYMGKLKDLSNVCTLEDDHYLAILLQILHTQYQKIYKAYLKILLDKGPIREIEVGQLISSFSESFNEAVSNFSHTNIQVISAGVFGQDPFAGKIANLLFERDDIEPRTQIYIKKYLRQVINYLQYISLDNVESNHPWIYKGYTQFLYVFEKNRAINEEKKEELVKELNDLWVEVVKRNYQTAIENEKHVESKVNKKLSDFSALLIYFHRDDPEYLKDLINPLVEIYNSLNENYADDDEYANWNLKRFYKRLKLIGAWINRFGDPRTDTPELYRTLKDDFYEPPKSRGKIPHPFMTRYGYPSDPLDRSREGWWLEPDPLWSYTGFQDEIANELNGENGTNYVEFHEKLKENLDEE